MSMSRKRPPPSRLFATLASVEASDASAAKRRRNAQRTSLRQSRAAAGQAKLHGALLELRILVQRCLTESGGAAGAVGGDGGDGGGESVDGGASGVDKAREEADALLENLLAARRELMGHQLEDEKEEGDGKGDESDDSDGEEEKEGVDYAKLIRQNKGGDDDSFSDGEGGSSDSKSSVDSDDHTLAQQLQREYASLRTHWQTTLDKHHANLALRAGTAVDASQFQSRAVDVSFWEQVKAGTEHARFRRRTAAAQSGGDAGEEEDRERLQFDDSKLYQQMLKDFISSSSAPTNAANQRGGTVDPAREAAERLKRAVRKKGGNAGDVDLAALLTDAPGGAGGPAGQAAKKKAHVDRRASKGRKIRYAVHPKLVNFAFPVARDAPAIREDVWFRSLFGGAGRL